MSAAHSITQCSVAHHRLIRARPRANRTFRLLVIPSLAPHPRGRSATAHLHNKSMNCHSLTCVKRTASALHVLEFTF